MNVNAVGASQAPLSNNSSKSVIQKPSSTNAVAPVVQQVDKPSVTIDPNAAKTFRESAFTAEPGNKALGAYLSVQNNEKREQVNAMFGLDVYA